MNCQEPQLDDERLLARAERDPVQRRGRDEEGGGHGGRHERDRVDRPLAAGRLAEALLEGDRQQEPEEDLHARHGDAQLVQELQELAVALLLLLLGDVGGGAVLLGVERHGAQGYPSGGGGHRRHAVGRRRRGAGPRPTTTATSIATRSWSSDRRIRRETCIWLMPTRSAISRCVSPSKKRRRRISRSRGASASKPPRSSSRCSVRSKPPSSPPRRLGRRRAVLARGRVERQRAVGLRGVQRLDDLLLRRGRGGRELLDARRAPEQPRRSSRVRLSRAVSSWTSRGTRSIQPRSRKWRLISPAIVGRRRWRTGPRACSRSGRSPSAGRRTRPARGRRAARPCPRSAGPARGRGAGGARPPRPAPRDRPPGATAAAAPGRRARRAPSAASSSRRAGPDKVVEPRSWAV